MFECPTDLSYSQRHMWTRTNEEEGTAEVGITEDLAEQLSEVLSIDMPMVGDELEMDAMCIHLHLLSDIFHLRSPLSGRVVEINRDVLDRPNLFHLAPFKHWLYRMEYDEPDEFEMLMNSAQYLRFIDLEA